LFIYEKTKTHQTSSAIALVDVCVFMALRSKDISHIALAIAYAITRNTTQTLVSLV